MKKRTIFRTAWAICSLALTAFVCVEWHRQGCGVRSLVAAVSFYGVLSAGMMIAVEEFLTAYRKHGEFIENKESGEKMNAYVDKNGIVILSTALNCTYTSESIRTLFGCYKFSDGTPCGKGVEL